MLKVLNQVMDKDGDWNSSADGKIWKLHPTTLISRSQELTVQVALALGQSTETNLYSREVAMEFAPVYRDSGWRTNSKRPANCR